MRRSCLRPVSSSLLTTAALAVLVTTLTGCFTTTADFGDDAEDFIVEDEGLRDTLRSQGRLDPTASFSSATCDEPANQDEGTSFACTAVDTTGATWEFEALITGSGKYDVNLSRAPDGA